MKPTQQATTSSRRSKRSAVCSSAMAVSLLSIGLFGILSIYFMVIHHHIGDTNEYVSLSATHLPSSTTPMTISTETPTDMTKPPLSIGTTAAADQSAEPKHNPTTASMPSTTTTEHGLNKAPISPFSADSTGRLHAVTYASHGGRDDRFCRAVESAIRHDVQLIILGWGVKWIGLSQKLEAAHHFAASLPPEDIILFTDAFDVMFSNTPQHILQEYHKEQSDIVFAGES